MKIRKAFMFLFAVAMIWACGKDEEPAPPKNNAPVIAAQTFSVAENIAAGTTIGTVTATDADKDALSFSIAANDNNLFAITKAGVLSLASGKSLDFATSAQHVITVSVSDGEASASAKVTINVTKVAPEDPDNLSPTIEPQEFTVIESIDDTHVIGTVAAADPEDDTLGFAIAVNDNELFEIDPLTGELSLAEGKQLDFGNAQEHGITVGVSDGVNVTTAVVTIKLTEDMAPTGNPQEFSVVENIGDAEVIGTVVAEDPEGKSLVFTIKTNDNDLFEITDAGELTLADGKQLDFETMGQHNIVVSVSDGFNSIDIEVTILVEDDGSLADDPTSFVTVWKTGVNGESIIIGTDVNYTYDYTIDWGDGTIEDISVSDAPQHVYETAGTYTIAINGQFPALQMKNGPSVLNLMSIEQWGAMEWKSLRNAFEGCSNMIYNATDVPNLSMVVSLHAMFKDASSFNGEIGNWDLSNILSLSSMFSGATSFNSDIVGWDVSNVQEFGSLFSNASAFNQDIGSWEFHGFGVVGMFHGASSFNQDISGWDMSNVLNMNGMFQQATAFNQDISNWDVSNVTNMPFMFDGATSFDQDLGNWLVQNVTYMGEMFSNSGMSPENYGNTLVGWASKAVQTNVSLGAEGGTYCSGSQGEAARTWLIEQRGWGIQGDTSVQCQ